MSNCFSIKLANLVIRIDAIYPSTKEFCNDYLVDNNLAADFLISICDEDIRKEYNYYLEEKRLTGEKPHRVTNQYLETLAVYRKIANDIISYDAVLFHGSVVSVNNKAYLFTALSGTGKSTHTRLWREMLGDEAIMINDDKPILRLIDNTVYACGTPWNGKHKLDTNIMVPLEYICIMERSEDNWIKDVELDDCIEIMIQQSYKPVDSMQMCASLQNLDDMLCKVKICKMGCNMDISAAEMAYTFMNNKNHG